MPETEETGTGIKGTLTKRYGPLPAWGWGAVVIGGVVVFIVIRKRMGSAAGATGTQQQGIGFGPGGGAGGGAGGGGAGGTDTGTGTGTGTGTTGTGTTGTGTGSVPPGGQGAGAPTNNSSGGNVDTSWQPNAVAPITTAEEAAVRTGNATPTIAAKALANGFADTVNGLAQQVGGSTGVIGFNVGAMGSTEAQREQYRGAVAAELVNRGFTASSYGGQVYAARNSQAYFAGLPQQARNDLARLLTVMHAQGKL